MKDFDKIIEVNLDFDYLIIMKLWRLILQRESKHQLFLPQQSYITLVSDVVRFIQCSKVKYWTYISAY